jgi:hypothetical protein
MTRRVPARSYAVVDVATPGGLCWRCAMIDAGTGPAAGSCA